jgi:hypothetical protein
VNNPSGPLADEVLTYFVQHPQAEDTVEGLVEWRLLEQESRYGVAEAEAALSDLVDHDYLIECRRCDGRTCYGLNRAKEREIRMHLKSAPTENESESGLQA